MTKHYCDKCGRETDRVFKLELTTADGTPGDLSRQESIEVGPCCIQGVFREFKQSYPEEGAA